jgi:outer membrane immunogenic protein
MKTFLAALAAAAAAFSFSAAHADGMPRGGAGVSAGGSIGSSVGGCSNRFGGFYVGGHIAAVDYTATAHETTGYGYGGDLNDQGFGGGGQIGYNWQNCSTVFGVEADLTWLNAGNSGSYNSGSVGLRADANWMGTIRTKAGLAFDNLMLFVTGGLAYAEFEHAGSYSPYSFNDSDVKWGWVVGAGAEFAVTDRISLNSDFLWARFDDETHALDTYRFAARDEVITIRTGLNFKIGGDRRLEDVSTAGPMK